MRRVEIEAWALRVVDAVKAGQHNEDSRVEMKAEWPRDHGKQARRVAGHANAARGDDVLWLVGLDESGGVTGAQAADTASWWAAVNSFFHEKVPYLTDVVVHVDGLTVVALHFDSTEAPYVVRNQVYGVQGGGPVEREVPWREGTAVRSAHRSDLVRMLVPRIPPLGLEIMSASVNAEPRQREGDMAWTAHVSFYVTSPMGYQVVIPWHQVTVSLAIPACNFDVGLGRITLVGHAAEKSRLPWEPEVRVETILTGSDQVVIAGPGRMALQASGPSAQSAPTSLTGVPSVLHVEWLAVGADQAQSVVINLDWKSREPQTNPDGSPKDEGWRGRWVTLGAD